MKWFSLFCIVLLAGCSKHRGDSPAPDSPIIPSAPGPTCVTTSWEQDGNTQSPGFVYPYSAKVSVKPYDTITYSWAYPNKPTAYIAYNPKNSPLISFIASGQVVTVTIYDEGLLWAMSGTYKQCN